MVNSELSVPYSKVLPVLLLLSRVLAQLRILYSFNAFNGFSVLLVHFFSVTLSFFTHASCYTWLLTLRPWRSVRTQC